MLKKYQQVYDNYVKNITRRFSLRAHAHNNHIYLDPDKLFYDIIMVNRKVINNINIEYSLRKEC